MTTNNDFYRPENPFSHTKRPNPENETRTFPPMPTVKETAFDVDCSLHSAAATSLAAQMARTGLGLSPGVDSLAKNVADAPEGTETISDSTPYHFNGLTPGEAERLAILAEEAGEVVRAVGKILRHGYDSYNPDKEGHLGNRGELELEIGDFAGIVDLMIEAGDINEDNLLAQATAKLPRIKKYAHHQENA